MGGAAIIDMKEDVMTIQPFLRLVAGLLAALMVLVACATAPVTGRKQLLLISEEQADQMGEQAYQEIIAKSRLSSDPQQNARVQRIGQHIAVAANKPGYRWEFKVIDEPKTINAWALPGGKTAVYTGLLNLNLTDDELATVMAHEVAHALAQHSRERISQQLGFELGMRVLGAAGLSPGQLEAVNLAFGIGVGLPFSRRQESEADLVGLDLMSHAGYDPRAALSLWKKMAAASGNGPPEFLSTHPSSKTRTREIEQALPRYVPIYEANKRPA